MSIQPANWDGARIRELRVRAGLSQSGLATAINRLTGMHANRHTVSRWECGPIAPGPYARLALDAIERDVDGTARP